MYVPTQLSTRTVKATMLRKALYKLRLYTLFNTPVRHLGDMSKHTAQPGQQTLHNVKVL